MRLNIGRRMALLAFVVGAILVAIILVAEYGQMTTSPDGLYGAQAHRSLGVGELTLIVFRRVSGGESFQQTMPGLVGFAGWSSSPYGLVVVESIGGQECMRFFDMASFSLGQPYNCR